jgi:hypothetical protein
MTDEGGAAAAGAVGEGDEAGTGATTSGLLGLLTTPELLMTGCAAWIFVVVFVVGDRITFDYSTSAGTLGAFLSLIVLATTYAGKMGKGGLGSFYPWLARTAVWGIAVFAVLDLVNGVTNDFVGNFYEVTLYIAAAAGAAGAYLQAQGS